MDDLLLNLELDSAFPASAGHWFRRLSQEVAELRGEVARLRLENLDLRQQVGYWKSQHALAVQRLEKSRQEVERLQGEVRQLKSQAFGRRTEKEASPDRRNFLEGEVEAPAAPPPRGQRRGQPGPQRRGYAHLPAREEVHDLPEAQRQRPECGLPFAAHGSEDSEQVEIETVAYRRVVKRRRYRRSCGCGPCAGPRTITAPGPPKLIPKGVLGASLWTEILLDKFASHRPTERLLTSWRSLGLDVAAGTVADGLKRLEPLFAPIHAALAERNRLSSHLQADETRWAMFVTVEGKTGHRWWLWVFVGADTVVFTLDPSRSRAVPEAHLPHDGGQILMVDRYSSYKAMAQVKDGQVVLAFCWAHVRRDFIAAAKSFPELKAWALDWLGRIRELYRLDGLRRAEGPPEAERKQADAELRETLQAMQTQAAAELADAQLRQPCRKILRSLQEHWPGLTRFVDDRRVPLDNNASERQIRGPALGRKNYYGSGSLWSGRLAASLFSLFATLQKWELNPRAWLAGYLQACAENGGKAPKDLAPFLPWSRTPERRAALAAAPL